MSVVRAALAAVLALCMGTAMAQTTDQVRPARGPVSEAEVPNAAPPASTSQTTGATGQAPLVKSMNEAERSKVEEHGK